MKFKMHKILFIAFFVLVSNSGIAFTIHFCGGKLAAISSEYNVKSICKTPKQKILDTCCDKQELDFKKCCSNKKISLKSNFEKFVIKTTSSESSNLYFLIPIPYNIEVKSISKGAITQKMLFVGASNSPPLYLLHHQFTFYG
jgi:hypothetical protein